VIAFATQFLGLFVGIAPVTVLVDRSVASVVYELDGRRVGRLDWEPWTLAVDFGRELLPHEVVVRAFDQDGKEMGAAHQFVNLPRPHAEVEVVLERNSAGRPVAARYSGQSLISQKPDHTTVTLDGKPLVADASNRVELPAYDPGARHVLSVELDFARGVRSRADVVFGAGEVNAARSELTAVPVGLVPPRKSLDPSELAGALIHGDQELPIEAVENASALVCVVRNPSVAPSSRMLGEPPDALRYRASLVPGDRVRFIWPVPQSVIASPGTILYDWTGDFTEANGSLHQLLTRVEYSSPAGAALRLADAAAAAGLDASASGSRRAVVLVLGGEKVDRSRHNPKAVRQYLSAIGVPLYVWSLRGPTLEPLAKSWGEVSDISSAARLAEAVQRLKSDLARQRIVWVDGRFLPQEISLLNKTLQVEFVH